MLSQPEKQHEWLKQLVGEWTCEGECFMGPDQPPMKNKGTERVAMLGDLWVILEGKGEMPDGGAMESRMTVGYDPTKKKFVGTWIGSPMAHLFVYEGELDATGKVLPLKTMGPSFMDPTKMVEYHDVIEITGPNERLLWSQTQGPDGKWMKFMTMRYTRV